jgi:hypothetical protein
MDALPAFVAGIVVGLVLAGVIAWIRRGSVTDLGSPGMASPPVQPSPPPATSDTSSAAGFHVEGNPSLSLQRTPTGFRGTRTIVHRVAARLDPRDGLTIEADGETYHRLEDVPDLGTREQVRSILASLPGQIADPSQRDRVEAELHEAGIEEEAASEPPADAATDATTEPGAMPPPA